LKEVNGFLGADTAVIGMKGGAMRLNLMKVVMIFSLVSLVAGCCAVNQAFVKSMDSTHKAVAVEYEEYVKSDGDLSDDEKAMRLKTTKDWRTTIDTAAE
jgi:hypothetical protein